jgi:hypothetical protein
LCDRLVDVFARAEMALKLEYRQAAACLGEIIEGGTLGPASDEAYEVGCATILMRVGPVGDMPGLSKCVRVQLLPLRTSETETRLSFRWVATGISGALFPALDADLDLVPAPEQTSTLVVKARYEPPLGPMGGRLDRVLIGRAADLTLAALLRRLAQALTAPERQSVPSGAGADFGPALGAEGL